MRIERIQSVLQSLVSEVLASVSPVLGARIDRIPTGAPVPKSLHLLSPVKKPSTENANNRFQCIRHSIRLELLSIIIYKEPNRLSKSSNTDSHQAPWRAPEE